MESRIAGSLTLLGLLAMAAGQSPSVVQTPTVRYIRTQALVTESKEARAELEQLQELQKQKAAELRSRQQALEAVRSQLAQAADVATRTSLAQEEKRQRVDLEQSTVSAQSELQARQRQMQARLQARLKAVLDEILKTETVDVVLNAETAVVWAKPGADLTSTVVARLNAESSRNER